ncbi:unnamed protein product [Discosporangium mesarthrocarpum]
MGGSPLLKRCFPFCYLAIMASLRVVLAFHPCLRWTTRKMSNPSATNEVSRWGGRRRSFWSLIPPYRDNTAGKGTSWKAVEVDVDEKGVVQPIGLDETWGEQNDTGLQTLEIMCRDGKGGSLDACRLSEFLMEIGGVSVYVEDASHGTENETPVFHEPTQQVLRGNLVTDAAGAGRRYFWGNSRVVAYFPKGWDLSETMSSVEEVFGLEAHLPHVVRDVPVKDWVKSVQESWDPIDAGKLRIRFPWHDPLPPEHITDGQVELVLEGGRAFGTGEHPTTAMVCSWLQEGVPSLHGLRVLDYGSGSGVLGLAALKFGAKEAVGVEIDLESIVSGTANAENNGLAMDMYVPREVDSSQDLEVELTKITDTSGTPAMVEKVSRSRTMPASELGGFDVTVANILAGPLKRLEPVLAKMTKPGERVIRSTCAWCFLTLTGRPPSCS